MGVQGGNAGLVGSQRYQFTTVEGQTRVAGVDDRGFPLAYTPGENTLIVARNGNILDPDEYTAADGASVTFGGTLRAGDRIFAWALPAFNIADTYSRAVADQAFNRRRNRNYDPAARNSQEQGNAAIAMANGATVYPADGVACYRGGATGGVSVQRVQSITPAGSGNRIRFTVTAANGSPAANDLLMAVFPIEGQEILDLRFGSSSAKAILYRITLRMPVACKLTVAIRNSWAGPTRSWLGTIEILPGEVGQDVTKYVIAPGDTAGTWATDSNVGAVVSVSFQAGSTYQGVAGWQPGNVVGLAANSNMLATSGWTFDIMDWGTYDVSDITNPAPPRFELRPQYEDELQCLRYFRQVGNEFVGWTAAATVVEGLLKFSGPPMRSAPVVSLISGRIASFRFHVDNATVNVSDASFMPVSLDNAQSSVEGLWTQIRASGTSYGSALFQARNNVQPFINCNARMI